MNKNKREVQTYACDFETTVYEGQAETSVWSSAFVQLGTESVIVLDNIEKTIEWFTYEVRQDFDFVLYYHNLKFDGSFWVDYFLHNGFKYEMKKRKKLKDHTFTCVISDLGQWYKIDFAIGEQQFHLKDSLKLIPIPLRMFKKSFGTKHEKLDMSYTNKFSLADCSKSDIEYIKNDVLVLKEGLEYMFEAGHNKLTIGSCCLSEYKELIGKSYYEDMFPDLFKIKLDPFIYGCDNADAYIRKSYHGGWCYVVKEKTNKIKTNGVTADVNSLYPSMMHSESGNRYPVGTPTFWNGNFIPDKAKREKMFYFVTFKCRFVLKKDMLPTVQIKSSPYYLSTEWLTDSRPSVYGNKVKQIQTKSELITDRVELTMTQMDFELFQKHYYVSDLEILHGCYFYTDIGIFDIYIDKYKKMKIEASESGNAGAKFISKLFLNNLYGKFSTNTESFVQVPFLTDDNDVSFEILQDKDKKGGFIAIGSAITSYARNFTINVAQLNYYGENKKGFIYADTDSIHCDLSPEEVKGIKVHPTNFCCWKLESSWDKGIFVRQKTYIEHVTHEDLEPVYKPYYNVKCAGMPSNCKKDFIFNLEHGGKLTDFKTGLKLDGKLMPKRIKGGVVLVETTFEMR